MLGVSKKQKLNFKEMMLIADGGSTKTNWCLLPSTNQPIYFNTEGYNPYYVDTPSIVKSLTLGVPQNMDRTAVRQVYFYGAGCSIADKIEIVAAALRRVFPESTVFVSHDMLAAARAVLGHSPGFAAILGTGTNTCLYDGKEITLNIDSLGFMLGDEGSGSYIGRRFIRDYLRNNVPKELSEAFQQTYNSSVAEIMDRVYKQTLPNRYLASFTKFLYDNNHVQPYVRTLVKDSFSAFFKELVSLYPNYQNYSFNCIGSVAYNFRDVLSEVAHEYNMPIGKLLRSPIDDLVRYHLEEHKPG